MKQKILVIIGPTATGKSDLAVKLAKQFNGEIISADSRQVYKGLDIGTGKITPDEMQGIPHHLLDIIDPKERFSVIKWKELAEKCIIDISKRNKLPIICGGTGYYVSALLNNFDLPEIDFDPEEQKQLESKSAEELMNELTVLDPRRAREIDPSNKRRVARAIAIARALGNVPEITTSEEKFDSLTIGISYPDNILKDRIKMRLIKRLENGMIEEAQRLKKEGLSYDRMDELGLEYRYLSQFLQNIITREELTETLCTKIWQYARRQKTWFKKQKNIHWFIPPDYDQISETVAKWAK